jgi:hypothetical protein
MTNIATPSRVAHALRWIYLLLAVGLPVFFARSSSTQTADLNALMTRGQVVTGHITHFSGAANRQFAHYRYVVDNREYNWDVDAAKVPGIEGAEVAITYLPEAPRKHWLGPPLTNEVIETETRFGRRAVFGTLAVFGLLFIVNEFDIRRKRTTPGGPLLSPRASAIVMSILMFAILIGVQFDPKVRNVATKAFGERPLGLPNLAFVILCTAVLYLPAPWVFLHMSRLVRRKLDDGAMGGSTMGFLLYLARVGRIHPELRRSQRIVTLGFWYFLVLAALWIAYTVRRGI